MADKKIVKVDDESFLMEAREQFKESEAGLDDIIKKAQTDLSMFNGEGKLQWDEEVRQFRESQGMVCITENLLPSFVDQVEGDFRQKKPDISCVGVDGNSDPGTARIIAGMIRNIHYQSNANMIHNEVFLQMLTSSFGAWQVTAQYEDPMSFNQELRCQSIGNHLALRWDLNCKEYDMSDKAFVHVPFVMRLDDFKEKYGEESVMSFEQARGSDYEGWYIKDGIVRLSRYWKKEDVDVKIHELEDGSVVKDDDVTGLMAHFKRLVGKTPKIKQTRTTQIPRITFSLICGNKILEQPEEWDGRYIPIVIAYGKRMLMDGKLNLKSLFRDAIESQKMHNYLVSSMVQSVAMQTKAPYVGTNEQFKGKRAEWEAGADGNVPFLTYNPDPMAGGPPRREMPPVASQGYAELLQFNAKTRMDIIGIHEAGLGMRSNEQSGVAIRARQQEGDVGTFSFMDNFKLALQFECRVLIDQIPRRYDTSRMQRILGVDNKDEIVHLYEVDQNGQPVIDERTGKQRADLSVGKYDVVLSDGMNYTTQREQTRDSMMQVIQAMGPQNPAVMLMLPTIIRNLDWENSDNLAKALESQLPQQLQQILSDKGDGQQGQMSPQMMQMQQAMQQQMQQMQQSAQEMAQHADQTVQQLTQENQQLKSGLQVKMAEIEAKKELGQQDMALKREEYMLKLTLFEKELEHKDRIAQEELAAKLAADIKMSHEKIMADMQMRNAEMSHAANLHAITTKQNAETMSHENESKKAESSPHKESSPGSGLTVVIDGKGGSKVIKHISLTSPSGAEYKGSVTEEGQPDND